MHLAGLLRCGRWLSAWRDARVWATVQHVSPWSVLATFGFGQIRPVRGATALARQTERTLPPWLQPEFRRQQTWIDPTQTQTVFERAMRHHSPSIQAALRCIHARAGDVLRWSVGVPNQVQIAHPFLDPRVIYVALGTLAHTRPEPGLQKPLLQAAFRNVLPELIRKRRAKGHFDELYYTGLNRNHTMLAKLLRDSGDECRMVLNTDQLLAAVDEACLAGADGFALQRLDASLAMVQWFATRSAWERQELPTPTMEKTWPHGDRVPQESPP